MLFLVTSNKLSAKLLILIFSDIVGNFSLTTSADDVMIFIFSLECPFDDFFYLLSQPAYFFSSVKKYCREVLNKFHV